MRTLTSNLKQAGISLLEVLLSLSIIAIILVMATRYFFVANNTQKINTVRQQLGVLIAGIQQYKTQEPNKAFTLQNLYDIGALADSPYLVVDSGTAKLYNPWNQELTVTGVAGSATVAIGSTVPKVSDCNALKSSYQGNDNTKYPYLSCTGNTLTLTISG